VPHAVSRISMLVLALGLPVVMTLAWYHGARANRHISGPELTIISILLVIGSLLFYVFAQPATEATTQAPPAEKAQSAAVGARPAPTAPGISVAVLPFANLSGDTGQEFFSDGMTEEIMTALARVSALRVVGRESAFQFKGQKTDMRAVGQALSANYLVEGSVRKAGDQVRITAQLVQADNGVSVWTDSYDRELKNIFTTQSDIAQAIAGALRAPLGLKAGQNLVSNRTADTDSYQDYLRARALVRARGPRVTEAARLLEQVVARDPNYAPAWGLLGQAYALTPNYFGVGVTGLTATGLTDDIRRLTAESLQKAEAAAHRATRLDPNNIDGNTALASARGFRGEYVQAEDSFKQALSLDPGNSDALHLYSAMLAAVGRLKDSLAIRLRLQAQEPFNPGFKYTTATVLWDNRRNEEAIAIAKALGKSASLILAEVYASMGRYSEAADALEEMPSGAFPPGAVEEAIRLLRTAPAQDTSPQTILRDTRLGFVYLYVGAPNRVLDFSDGLVEAGYIAPANLGPLWAPSYAPVRKTERFKAFARTAGMVDYWRARGWPDLCRPMGADDFVCD
jgi:adenylate cyclase